MSELGDYNSSLSAEQIESKLVGGIVFNGVMSLTETQKAQARANIGAGTTSSGLQIKGFFTTYEELIANITKPNAGDSYAVGTKEPYNIYIWDGLNKIWVANGLIRGADGTDANVTTENIVKALGYTPYHKPDDGIPAADLADHAVSSEYTATITALGWTGDGAPYTNEVTVTGLSAADNPFVDMVASSTFATAETEIEAFANIYRMVTAENKLTVYATDKPTVDLNIQIKAVRK